MPGFAATPVEKDAMKSGFCCPHCELMLREPVQTEDGSRLCKDCFHQISKMPGSQCKKCNITVSGEVYPDRAVQRELLLTIVHCLYVALGCAWQGKLKDWESHTETCAFKGVSCTYEGCNQMLLATQLEEHQLECGYRPAECKHCHLKLPFNKLQNHFEGCEYFPVECKEAVCKQLVPRNQLIQHAANDCPVQSCVTCSCKVLRATGQELDGDKVVHLSDPFQSFSHHQELAVRHLTLAKELDKTVSSIDEMKGELNKREMDITGRINNLEKQMEKRLVNHAPPDQYNVDNSVALKLKQLETQDAHNQTLIKALRKEAHDLKTEIQALRREVQQLQRTGQPSVRHSGRDTQGGYEREASETRVLQLEKRVEEVARQANTAQIQVHEVELQLQASLASTYNGGFLWRIPEISRRRRDAVEERVMSLYSPPFYTARNGYKMCIRAYLNGDGMGYKTHLSLFFVLMKGEFDALLKWPFEDKISMILVDQDHRKHIVQTFKPTLDSNSFQRPKTDMNVASGCPQFAKLNILDETNYVREDVLFIKCIVDTSKIFHP